MNAPRQPHPRETLRRTPRCASARIVGRYRRAGEGQTEVIISDGGVVSAEDARRLLRRQVGPLTGFRFVGPRPGSTHEVLWEAATTDGRTVTGTLVLHGSASKREVVVWAELVPDLHREAGVDPRDRRFEAVARIGRRLIHRLQGDPRMSSPDVIAAVAAMVDFAEQGLGEA